MIDLFFVCSSFCEWRFHMFYLSLVLLDDNREGHEHSAVPEGEKPLNRNETRERFENLSFL